MNVLKAIVNLALASITLVNANAQMFVTVNWAAQTDHGLGTSSGSPLGTGNLIRIGSFDITSAAVQAQRTDFDFLSSHFTEFGTALIGDGSLPAGYWSKATQGSANSLGINGEQIYIWGFNDPVASSATEYGIFTAQGNPSWLFPADNPIPQVTTIDLNQVAQSGLDLVVGSYGTGSANGFPLYNLAAIPEPAAVASVTAVLCLLGTIFFSRGFRGGRCFTTKKTQDSGGAANY